MAYRKELSRGSFINLLGLVAKLVHPLFLVVILWLFGTDIVGLYFLAVSLVTVLNYLVYAGYTDAAVIFASPCVGEQNKQDELYRVFANAFAIPTALSVLVVGAGLLGTELFVAEVYPNRPGMVEALHVLVWSVPLLSLSSICTAATKAMIKMEYDVVINGTVSPLLLLAMVFGVWWLDGGLVGLMLARVGTQAVVVVLMLWAYSRHFSFGRTLRAIAKFRLHRDMLRFAVPQNLNMTFNRYITRLDVLMLGAFGFSNHALAFYAAGALITSNLREIKQVFTSVLGPIVARHHAAGDRVSLIDDLSRVTRWTTTIIVPAVLVTLVLRDDILVLFDATFIGDTTFMAILLVSPFLSCATGLTGNCVVWTRHSSWNLVNSMTVAALNTGLNLLMIPWLGLAGAALATITASTVVSVAQMVELYYLEGAYIRAGAVAKPWLGLALGLLPIAALWDPTELSTLGVRLLTAAALAIGFFGLMVLLRHPEVLAFLRLKRSDKAESESESDLGSDSSAS